MPRPFTEQKWIAQIFSILENAEQWPPDPEISERLRRISPDAPAPRTAAKYKAVFREQPVSVRQSYRELHFPEAMMEGLIPWEAARSCLELLAFADQMGLPRPPMSVARMFWTVDRWGLELSLVQRINLAVTIASHTENGHPLPAGMEFWLAYHARGEMQRYEEAVSRPNSPLPRYEPALSVAEGGPSGVWGALLPAIADTTAVPA
jgi:hypothetical protein